MSLHLALHGTDIPVLQIVHISVEIVASVIFRLQAAWTLIDIVNRYLIDRVSRWIRDF